MPGQSSGAICYALFEGTDQAAHLGNHFVEGSCQGTGFVVCLHFRLYRQVARGYFFCHGVQVDDRAGQYLRQANGSQDSQDNSNNNQDYIALRLCGYRLQRF